MGQVCSPGEDNTEKYSDAEQDDTEKDSDAELQVDKFSNIINEYHAKNEELQRQLDEFKNENDEKKKEREERARRNEKVVRELNAMRVLLEIKNQALVRERLEAALLSRATSMLAIESTSKLCIEGNLKYNYRAVAKFSKLKYVEIHLFESELDSHGFKAGYVMLLYSDSKGAQSSNRCQVISVAADESAANEQIFSIKVLIKDTEKELVFECESIEEKRKWKKSIETALDHVKDTYDNMHKLFTLNIEFPKQQLGFRVAESIIEEGQFVGNLIEDDEKVPGLSKNEHEITETNVEKVLENTEKVVNSAEKVLQIKENEDEQVKVKNKASSPATTGEKPCLLLVCDVLDENLITAGLKENCVVRAVNDTTIIGRTFSQQLELLTTMQRPIKITFTGPNYLKQQSVQKQGYSSILNELVTDGKNAVKKAFDELVRGTLFEKELQESNDQTATISALLANQRRLLAVLQNVNVLEMEL